MDATNLLASLRDEVISTSPRLATLRDNVVTALRQGIAATGSVDTLHGMPLRLERLNLSHQGLASDVLRELLNVAKRGATASALTRVLWDSYQFCAALSREAIELARSSLTRPEISSSKWHLAAIMGLLELDTPGANSFSAEALLAAVPPEDFGKAFDLARTRWEGFLVALGLSAAGNDGRKTLSTLTARLDPLLKDVTEAHTEASRRLVSRLTSIVQPMS